MGISNLKINPALLDSLHTEMQLNSALNIPEESCIKDAKFTFNVPAIPTMDENADTDENAATEIVNEESQEGGNDKDSQSENDKSQDLEG